MIKNKKIKIAFIKYNGLSLGGTEKQLIRLAATLDKNIFDVDYYWSYPGIDLFGNNKTMPNPTPIIQKRYLEDNGVKTIEFKVEARDISTPTHKWIGTNFWKIFDYKNYDIVQTAKSGHPEYPFTHIPKPIIEWNIFGGVDFSKNIYKTVCISKWIYDIWISNGGNSKKGEIIYPGIPKSTNPDAYQKKLLRKDEITLGFHQRKSDNIFSPIPLKVFSNIKNKVERKNRKIRFIILGGSDLYRKQAKKLNLLNDITFLNPTARWSEICNFLSSLDIYCHGRKDGECHGTAIQEAMLHGLPIVSHKALMNGHIEIIKDCGKVCENEEDYEEYLTRLILDDKLRLELGHKARELATEKYLIDSTKNKFEELYTKVLGDFTGVKKCSQTIPQNGYKNPNIFILIFYRMRYCFLNPREAPFIIKKTFIAFSVKFNIFFKKILKRDIIDCFKARLGQIKKYH